MRLQRTTSRLLSQASRQDIHRAGRDVGHELPRKDWMKLRALRLSLALADKRGQYLAGYRDAVADICAAFEAAHGVVR